MRVPPFAALLRATVTAWYLAMQTASDIVHSAWHLWRTERSRIPLPQLLRRLVKICRYDLGGAVDPRMFFPIDAGVKGHRRRDLDRAGRRQRRGLADLRRRHASMLLHALGDTADEVEATLTRHWQLYGYEYADLLVEDYLVLRLLWRDRPPRHQIDVYPWASNISGVWVATPAPVRRYLQHRYEHQRRLEAAHTRRPRRGPRPAPALHPA
ncbi:hypothetical protein WEI85_00690 [Actinomycetes bacterium KLBMP 9797]